MRRAAAALAIVASVILVAACGGGGGSTSSGGSSTPPPVGSPSSGPIQITTGQVLPGALRDHPYTTALAVANAHGAVKWSVARVAPTALFIEGLSIDSNTGVISGTARFGGTAGFIATVTDSEFRTATKGFYITGYETLSAPATSTLTAGLYQQAYLALVFSGGVPPFTITFQGSIPPGLRYNSNYLRFEGAPNASGSFAATLTIRDSYSPQEVVTQQVTFNVLPPPFQLVYGTVPTQVPVNVPFSGAVVARGGTPPYQFALKSGAVPPGTTFDPATGKLTGTPTQTGQFGFEVRASDSSSPAQTAGNYYYVTVRTALSRNDTIQTATALSGDSYLQASLSPYIDPPDKAPNAADHDYYQLVSVSGAKVRIYAESGFSEAAPVDPVVEVVDANGVRLSSCRDQGSNGPFTSPCLNDNATGLPNPTDAGLELQVPGAPSTPTTFYVHVFDWRGDARPDMGYALIVNGVQNPLTIISPDTLRPGTNGRSYFQQLNVTGAVNSVSWVLTSGSLPPGLALSPGGSITGTPATNGSYSFTAQVSDGSNPPQVASKQFQIDVVDPVAIVSSATFPDACLNQPYSFTMQKSGGIAPFSWSFWSSSWPAVNMVDNSTGTFSGTPGVLGTFTGTVFLSDATGNGVQQKISLTVKNCP